MSKNKAKKESGKATLAGVRKEMAQPRVAKSALKKYIKLALKVERPSIRLYLPKPETRPVVKQLKSHFEGEILRK
jgi:hypothetical protein